MISSTEKLLLTIDEAALALSLSRGSLYQMVMDGTIPSVKLGGARRIPSAALESWVAEQAQAQAEELKPAPWVMLNEEG